MPKNFKNISFNLLWCDVGNSVGLDLYEANIPDVVRDTFSCDHNEVLMLCSEYSYNEDNSIKNDLVDIDPAKVMINIHQKTSIRLVIAQLNFNSFKNKFLSLSTIIKDYVDLLLIPETKID